VAPNVNYKAGLPWRVRAQRQPGGTPAHRDHKVITSRVHRHAVRGHRARDSALPVGRGRQRV